MGEVHGRGTWEGIMGKDRGRGREREMEG